jgi:tRNA(Ile)-lysidine synthase
MSHAGPRNATTNRPETVALDARRHPLVAAVERALRTRCGVAEPSTILVGVSGGADSVALLLALLVLRDRRDDENQRLTIEAAHVHHHLRGESADADAAFVADLGQRFGVPLHIEHVHPTKRTGNVADNARMLRYAALERLAHEINAGHIAVAHHADDQLETMLIALCRGAGIDGLTGMPWTRPIGKHLTLIRPLLERRRAECESFCRVAGIDWRDDPSNVDPAYLRARLRRDVLPILEGLFPDAARRATTAADALDAARAALDREIAQSFGEPSRREWPRRTLAALPIPVIAAGLRRAALDAAPDLSDELGARLLRPAAETVAAETTHPKQFHWPDGWCLNVTAHAVNLSRNAAHDDDQVDRLSEPGPVERSANDGR